MQNAFEPRHLSSASRHRAVTDAFQPHEVGSFATPCTRLRLSPPFLPPLRMDTQYNSLLWSGVYRYPPGNSRTDGGAYGRDGLSSFCGVSIEVPIRGAFGTYGDTGT